MGLTIQDFWQFQFSNIWDLQEHIAEFLVAKALGVEKPYNRNGWTPFDILYRNTRIEVKETGYFYSWQKNGKTSERRTFGVTQTYLKDINGKGLVGLDGRPIKERQNDIYVFCLNTGKTQEESNPLELEHWEFYVISTKVINEQCGKNKTISLERVRTLSKCISFENLKAEVNKLII